MSTADEGEAGSQRPTFLPLLSTARARGAVRERRRGAGRETLDREWATVVGCYAHARGELVGSREDRGGAKASVSIRFDVAVVGIFVEEKLSQTQIHYQNLTDIVHAAHREVPTARLRFFSQGVSDAGKGNGPGEGAAEEGKRPRKEKAQEGNGTG